MNLREAACRLGVEFKGPAETQILGVRDIELLRTDDPLENGFVYFIESSAVLRRYPCALKGGIILTPASLAGHFEVALIAPDKEMRLAFIRLLSIFDTRPRFEAGIAMAAHVHVSARLGEGAAVLAGAVVMEGASIAARSLIYPCAVVEPHAHIGEDTVIYPCAVIGRHCVIGNNGIIHGCTVIGADGFGFFDSPSDRHKIPQIGNVVIGNDVEIGASCTIDRATIESTRVGDRTKIDDQVHIGHNCQVGTSVYIAGNTTLGGSVTVEDGCMISGNVVIRDHVHLACG